MAILKDHTMPIRRMARAHEILKALSTVNTDGAKIDQAIDPIRI
jgi:hypothetical protein